MYKVTADNGHCTIRESDCELCDITRNSKSRYREVLAAILNSQIAKQFRLSSLLLSLVKTPDFEIWFMSQIFGQSQEIRSVFDMLDVRYVAVTDFPCPSDLEVMIKDLDIAGGKTKIDPAAIQRTLLCYEGVSL